ncbi:hypothetical protein WR25_14697 [Diploscapter pachys]|uniref:Enoyl-[acyl-carrier-protein] reductase, mitochondrial n=1 Tax=Diploscapter pachys TaxID=2018661 RepID=A0A2A2KNT5_9BILA|nr:hypothetical protein WR25_14697 [Diploscapter pachys]
MLTFRGIFRISARNLTTKQLVYAANGNPPEAIKFETVELPDKPLAGHVHVKWIASPINPADLNQIQGVYPVKPTLPAVGGNEGFGRVEQIGEGVTGFKVGDHVLPGRSGLGTWREHGHHKQDQLFVIDNTLSLEASAVLQVNPPTAYRMLKDFVYLKPGDVVLQNAGNSAVSRYVIQLCKILGFRSVSVVRKRDDLEKLVEDLKSLGADEVYTEEELCSRKIKTKGIKLALNSVGGKSSLFLAAHLEDNGVMVTYGGMSKQPVQCPTGPLIFKDIKLVGYWMSRWYEQEENIQERHKMYADLGKWIKAGQLKTPCFEKRKITDHVSALEDGMNKFDRKQLFVF